MSINVMSFNELVPLFPSALHPAIPIATQILSTLRNLTAPGRGNDLRVEERAALVGVSALLGCERVQSKDLVESSAQKASSVSPARFKAALAKSRRLLETVSIPSSDPSPSHRRPTSSSPSKGVASQDPEEETVGQKRAAGPTLFSTPKKRYKHSSGIDISDLVKGSPGSRHKHEPATASPLRQSVTPSSRKLRGSKGKEREDEHGAVNAEISMEGDELGNETEDARTPTKKTKHALRQGVDLSTASDDLPDETPRTIRSRMDTSAFFALRPGSGSPQIATNGQSNTPGKGKYLPVEDGLPEVRPPRRKRPEAEKKRTKRRKRDWTYSEGIWGNVTEADRLRAQKLFDDLPAWLQTHGRPSLAETEVRGTTVEEILLSGRAKAALDLG